MDDWYGSKYTMLLLTVNMYLFDRTHIPESFLRDL